MARVASSECPPSAKKVVVGADRVDVQHLGEDLAQHPPASVAGGTYPLSATERVSGAGSARRSILPVVDSGNASSATNADGTM